MVLQGRYSPNWGETVCHFCTLVLEGAARLVRKPSQIFPRDCGLIAEGLSRPRLLVLGSRSAQYAKLWLTMKLLPVPSPPKLSQESSSLLPATDGLGDQTQPSEPGTKPRKRVTVCPWQSALCSTQRESCGQIAKGRTRRLKALPL